jgi:hypothetical protein
METGVDEPVKLVYVGYTSAKRKAKPRTRLGFASMTVSKTGTAIPSLRGVLLGDGGKSFGRSYPVFSDE